MVFSDLILENFENHLTYHKEDFWDKFTLQKWKLEEKLVYKLGITSQNASRCTWFFD